MDSKGLSQKGSLLLLLVSNLLLCKNVAPHPVCPKGVKCQLSLKELFDRAIILSSYIHKVSSDLFIEYNRRYSQGRSFITKAFNSCHTSTLATPEGKEQAQQIPQEQLLNLVLSVLRSWDEPLYHLIAEMRNVPEIPSSILSKTVEIEEQNHRLLQGMEKIISQVHPGAPENNVYAEWYGLPSLQTTDKESQLIAFYNLIHCLRRDSHKIDNFLKLLKCRIIYNNRC